MTNRDRLREFAQWITEFKMVDGIYSDAQAKLSEDMIELWGRTYKRFLGEKVEPMIEPNTHDPRFRDKEWSEHAFFDFYPAGAKRENWKRIEAERV